MTDEKICKFGYVQKQLKRGYARLNGVPEMIPEEERRLRIAKIGIAIIMTVGFFIITYLILSESGMLKWMMQP